jgi:hypothetical protein
MKIFLIMKILSKIIILFHTGQGVFFQPLSSRCRKKLFHRIGPPRPEVSIVHGSLMERLQMRRHDKQREAVKVRYADGIKESAFDAQSQRRGKVEELMNVQDCCMRQYTEGSVDFVDEFTTRVGENFLPGRPLALNGLLDDPPGTFEKFAFGRSQGGSIGKLEKIADDRGVFAEKTPRRDSHPACGQQNLVDVFREDERRQMHKKRDPQARSRIGRATRKKSPPMIESKIQLYAQGVVNSVERRPKLFRTASRIKALHTKVVFLIDHDADAPRRVNDDAAVSLDGQKLGADQAPFDKDLALDFGKPGAVDTFEIIVVRGPLKNRRDILKHLRAFEQRCPVRKTAAGEVARKPDTRGNDNVGVGPLSGQPSGWS